MSDHNELNLQQISKDLAFLKREFAEQKDRISLLERTVHSRRPFWEKLQPTLWNYRQHDPRRLNVPAWYHQQRLPADVPQIAMVTPSLNGAAFLASTIDSVLSQAYPRLSYLVQDGASTDGTQSILQSYGTRLIWRSERDRGQADAINRGFETVSGDIMGYLNSDDLLLPGTLAFVADAFARNPKVDLVYGNRITIDESGREIGRIVLPPHDREVIKWADYIPQETLFWRRRVWEKIGPIDTSFSFAMDWDFILRAQAAGFKFRRLPRFLACFRIHMAQKTIAMADVGEDEQQRLRAMHLGGEAPTHREISRRIKGYLRKQILFHRLYKLGVMKL